MAEVNFPTRMFLPAALLILLSATTLAETTEEVKRCYWCGPLAEQVHRSQRAPPCGPTLQETTCDEGYTHCAVVATSPPYVESRLCVKFYQDECYSLYCNTSKTWRMICPCQGNLCNGQNTDRESTAFSTLTKIIGKNKRSKRSMIGAKGFINLTPRNKVVIENNTTMLPDNETILSLQPDDILEMEMVSTAVLVNDVIEEEVIENDDKKQDNENEENSIENEESEMQGDQPIEETNEAVTEDNENHVTDTTKPENIDNVADIKTQSIEPLITVPVINNDNDKLTATVPVETHEEGTEIPTLTSMLSTSIQIELSVIQIKNPKDNIPPPEALQQNVTPAKVSAPTTMATVEASTNENIATTTQYIKETIKNSIDKGMGKSKEDKNEGNNNGEALVAASEIVLFIHMIILRIIL